MVGFRAEGLASYEHLMWISWLAAILAGILRPSLVRFFCFVSDRKALGTSRPLALHPDSTPHDPPFLRVPYQSDTRPYERQAR